MDGKFCITRGTIMTFKIDKGTLYFEGVLDETCSFKGLQKELSNGLELKTSSDSADYVSIDLSGVKRANSTGIVVWLDFIKKTQAKFRYVKAPIWLVGQFNMIRGFFENGSYVESLQVPFYCSEEDLVEAVFLKIGEDIPILEDYTNFQLENRIIGGKEFEPDVEPNQYFSFICHNLETFKARFS